MIFRYKIMDISSVVATIENDGRVYSCGLASGVAIRFEHSQPDAIVIFDFLDKICMIDFPGCPAACIFMRAGSPGPLWASLVSLLGLFFGFP